MPGVAYTTGTGEGLKEVHFSLDYIAQSKNRARNEILGVLVHEVVHCYQHDGRGSCPGGLIEGVAGESIRTYIKGFFDMYACPCVCLGCPCGYGGFLDHASEGPASRSPRITPTERTMCPYA